MPSEDSTQITPVVDNEHEYTELEIRKVAWFLDALLEIDFSLKYKQALQS